MKVLILGSGGREHALAHAIAASPRLTELFIAPGNAGTQALAQNLPLALDDHGAIGECCRELGIDLVVVGPEAPLVAGLADDLRGQGVAVVGPSAAAAQLEGSKAFVKRLAEDNGIPTAASVTCHNAEDALSALVGFNLPVVIKADGLAAGKGVIIAQTRTEAEDAVRACFEGSFGAAGSRVVVEEFLTGEEISCFALCHGLDYRWLGSAQDHKRVGEGDTGPNTGGMGAYTPAPCLTPALEAQIRSAIIEPTLADMVTAGTPFTGILFAGIMLTARGPQLLEYNVRFGDPEAQAILPVLGHDALALFDATAQGQIAELPETLVPARQHALTVVMAAKGYPGDYERGSAIGLPARLSGGLEAQEQEQEQAQTIIFHAGTRQDGETLRANGGRVLAVTGLGSSLQAARERAYRAVTAIDWPEGFYRRDIGWRAFAPGDGAGAARSNTTTETHTTTEQEG